MKPSPPTPPASTGRQAALLMGLQFYYRLTGLALLMVISRRLAADDIGSFFFAVAFAESLAPLASFNLTPLLMRRVAAAPEEAGAHLAGVLGFRLATAPLYLLVAPLAVVFGGGLAWRVALPVAVFVLLENFYHNVAGFFLARGKVGYDVAVGAAVQTAFLAAFLAGMSLMPTLEVLLGACLFRGLALATAGLLVVRARLCPLRWRWDGRLLREGVPFLSLSVTRLLRSHAETLLIGFLAAAGSVAVYSLGLRVVEAALFVPMSFASALFPRLAAAGFDAANRAAFRRSALMLGALALAATGTAFFAARPLCVVMFGPMGGDVAPLLRLLAFQFPLSFGLALTGSALIALGHERRVLVAMMAGLSLSVAGCLMVVPKFGAFGAGAARIASSAVELGILVWWLGRLGRPQN